MGTSLILRNNWRRLGNRLYFAYNCVDVARRCIGSRICWIKSGDFGICGTSDVFGTKRRHRHTLRLRSAVITTNRNAFHCGIAAVQFCCTWSTFSSAWCLCERCWKFTFIFRTVWHARGNYFCGSRNRDGSNECESWICCCSHYIWGKSTNSCLRKHTNRGCTVCNGTA